MKNMIPKRQPTTSDWSLGDTKCNANKPLIISPSLPISQIFFVSNFIITFNEWSLSKLTKFPIINLFYSQIYFNLFKMIAFKTFYKIFFLVLLVLTYFSFYIFYWKKLSWSIGKIYIGGSYKQKKGKHTHSGCDLVINGLH